MAIRKLLNLVLGLIRCYVMFVSNKLGGRFRLVLCRKVTFLTRLCLRIRVTVLKFLLCGVGRLLVLLPGCCRIRGPFRLCSLGHIPGLIVLCRLSRRCCRLGLTVMIVVLLAQILYRGLL